MNNRIEVAESERAHGKWLRENDPIMQWGWGTSAGQRRARRRAALITEGSELDAKTRALEIGCGTGMFTEMFAASGANILAVDISADLLELARARGLPSSRVQFIESPFEECGAGGLFDAVIGSSVLHHLDYPVAFRRIFEMLKPGGRLSFAEPNRLNPQVWFCLRFREYFPQYSPDETAFYKWPLGRLLSEVGFVDVQITPFDWLHPSVPQLLISPVKALEWVIERVPGIKEFAGSLWIRARKPL